MMIRIVVAVVIMKSAAEIDTLTGIGTPTKIDGTRMTSNPTVARVTITGMIRRGVICMFAMRRIVIVMTGSEIVIRRIAIAMTRNKTMIRRIETVTIRRIE